MSVHSAFVRQFHRPSGLLGRFAGWVMANRGSNLARNRWSVDLLGIERTDEVLELGPGPGVTATLLLAKASAGHVTLIDHSPLMLAQCEKRNRTAVRSGRLTLIEAKFPGIPPGRRYDKMIAVNSLQFDAMNEATLRELASHLKAGGRLAVTFQPRGAGADTTKAEAFGQRASDLLRGAGFVDVRLETLPLAPVPAVCVLGSKNAKSP